MQSNQNLFETLRRKYPVFVYESFKHEFVGKDFHLTFSFKIGVKHEFTPIVIIPHRDFYQWEKIPSAMLDTLCFNIGMIELISYWKAVCSPKVLVQCGALNENQMDFWKKIYFYGLSEFFYLNGIATNKKEFITIEPVAVGQQVIPMHLDLWDDVLVPVGGGKDSVVTLELLRKSGEKVKPLILNPRGATLDCIDVAGFDRTAIVEINRSIDAHLLELNNEGYLNGHTPFSAMLAFYTLLASAATGFGNIALSNESSANESTIIGLAVNHQYSKSVEFEADFRKYVNDYISPDFNYFSFLRPLDEITIARFFAALKQYHPVFKSCNVGSKTDTWCGHCPKCLFAFIILSPFIEPQQMQTIFGKNLLDDLSLKKELDELTGISSVKPFECVGTVDEVNQALHIVINKYNKHLPALLDYYKSSSKYGKYDTTLSKHFEKNHFLNDEFQEILKKALEIL